MMVSEACALQTERLTVAAWHLPEVASSHGSGLPTVVAGLLTAGVTAALPPDWQGDYDDARASDWIRDRDADGPTLLAVERATSRPVGLLILFESPPGVDAAVDVRLGYLLGESSWGRGLGLEMVGAYVEWCRRQPGIATISAGVEEANLASIRILERCGFERVEDARPGDERHYRLEFHR